MWVADPEFRDAWSQEEIGAVASFEAECTVEDGSATLDCNAWVGIAGIEVPKTIVRVPDALKVAANAALRDPKARRVGRVTLTVRLDDVDASWQALTTLMRIEVAPEWEPLLERAHGRVSQDAIRDAVEKRREFLKACEKAAAPSKPSSPEGLRIVFVIEPDGHVSRVGAASGSGVTALVRCIEREFLWMRFPPPSGGGAASAEFQLRP